MSAEFITDITAFPMLDDLVIEVSKLRPDLLSLFLDQLSLELLEKSDEQVTQDQVRLGRKFMEASIKLKCASRDLREAWYLFKCLNRKLEDDDKK